MPDAYLDALKMLGRQELSEAQVRRRLARRGYRPDSIDTTVARLREARAIDDMRAAEAIARKRRMGRGGKLRARREIEAAGIATDLADRAVDHVFQDADPDALIDAALARRLRGRTAIADRSEAAKLYRYLVAQGFEPEQVRQRLEKTREDHED